MSEEESLREDRDTLGDLLPEGFDGKKGLVDKYASVQELASAYQNLAQKMSSTARVPSQDATSEEWNTFYQKMGRPETPHGYSMPEGEKERAALDPLSKAAHTAGLTKTQWESLSQVAQSQLVKDTEAEKAHISKIREEWQDGAKRRYGEDLDQKLALAKRSLDGITAENPDIEDVLSRTGLIDHPAVLDLMIQTGEKQMDDSTPSQGVSTPSGDSDPQRLAARARELTKIGALNDRRNPDYEKHIEEFMQIQAKLAEAGFAGATDPRLKSRY
tara:strand:+ start:400 stop:1218 length:819 start_codon:yes stop_codon:yes gene_type:complete